MFMINNAAYSKGLDCCLLLLVWESVLYMHRYSIRYL